MNLYLDGLTMTTHLQTTCSCHAHPSPLCWVWWQLWRLFSVFCPISRYHFLLQSVRKKSKDFYKESSLLHVAFTRCCRLGRLRQYCARALHPPSVQEGSSTDSRSQVNRWFVDLYPSAAYCLYDLLDFPGERNDFACTIQRLLEWGAKFCVAVAVCCVQLLYATHIFLSCSLRASSADEARRTAEIMEKLGKQYLWYCGRATRLSVKMC